MPFSATSPRARQTWVKTKPVRPSIPSSSTPALSLKDNHKNADDGAADRNSVVTSGFFHLAPGTPLVYTYTYHEMKIILEGDYTITDVTAVSEEQRKGDLKGWDVQRVEAKPGDVFYFPEGVTIRFETVAGGKAFYVSGIFFIRCLSAYFER